MEQAIGFEAARQIEILEGGGRVEQETRLYDPDRHETRSMRTKEDAQDYRYFPDPDLLPLVVTQEQIDAIRKALPELPDARRERYEKELHLTPYDAALLVESREKADYFDRSLAAAEVIKTVKIPPRSLVNWINGDLSARVNASNLTFKSIPLDADRLANLQARVEDGTISLKSAKDVIVDMWDTAEGADEIIDRKGLRQVTDAGAIEELVDEVLARNPRQVEDYRAGKDKAFNSLVGQVMKATQGKANPAQVNEILRKKLRR
jgi:aspartyl-tRNA(Asn)/glutamyl-tRNA(Gln) amidotransferase subunit B